MAVVVADVLRISRSEARRRVRDAEQLAPRTSLSGQLLPPVLPATAAAWAAGVLDPEHLRTIQKFMRELPDHVGPRSGRVLRGVAGREGCAVASGSVGGGGGSVGHHRQPGWGVSLMRIGPASGALSGVVGNALTG